MLKRLRAAHPLLYCILAEVLFLGTLFVSSFVLTVVLMLVGIDPAVWGGYPLSAVQELCGMGIAVLLLARTGRVDLLRQRGSGFLNGLLVGMYPLFFIGASAFNTLLYGRPDQPLRPLPQILAFLLNMALVGVAEEFVSAGALHKRFLNISAPAAQVCGRRACCPASCSEAHT